MNPEFHQILVVYPHSSIFILNFDRFKTQKSDQSAIKKLPQTSSPPRSAPSKLMAPSRLCKAATSEITAHSLAPKRSFKKIEISLGNSWLYHENIIGKIVRMSWEYHGNFTGISWDTHGNIMGNSWEFHGGIRERPCKNRGNVMECHGDTMVISRETHI